MRYDRRCSPIGLAVIKRQLLTLFNHLPAPDTTFLRQPSDDIDIEGGDDNND